MKQSFGANDLVRISRIQSIHEGPRLRDGRPHVRLFPECVCNHMHIYPSPIPRILKSDIMSGTPKSRRQFTVRKHSCPAVRQSTPIACGEEQPAVGLAPSLSPRVEGLPIARVLVGTAFLRPNLVLDEQCALRRDNQEVRPIAASGVVGPGLLAVHGRGLARVQIIQEFFEPNIIGKRAQRDIACSMALARTQNPFKKTIKWYFIVLSADDAEHWRRETEQHRVRDSLTQSLAECNASRTDRRTGTVDD